MPQVAHDRNTYATSNISPQHDLKPLGIQVYNDSIKSFQIISSGNIVSLCHEPLVPQAAQNSVAIRIVYLRSLTNRTFHYYRF